MVFEKVNFSIVIYVILSIISFDIIDRNSFGICHAQGAVFFEENFEAIEPRTFLSQYYGSLAESERFSIQSLVKANGNYGLRYHFVAGTKNVEEYVTQHFGDSIAGPVLSNDAGNQHTDIYIQLTLYYSSEYDWSASNNKIIIIGTQDDRRHDNVCCNPWVSHYITILAGNIGSRGYINAEGNNKRADSGQWYGLSPNINGYSSTNHYFLNTERWYTIEVHKRLNDPGISNGIFEMWVDGVKIAEYFNVLYRVPWDGTFGSNGAYGTNFVMLTTYINNPAPRDQNMYYDSVKLSTTYIGILTNSAPNTPSGLRVTQ